MTKDELRNHLADILDDQSPLPREQSLDAYTDALWKTLLYQLQKARQDWLREEIVKLEGDKEQDECVGEERKNCPWCSRNIYCRNRVEEIAHNETLQTIIDRYQAELDQDNK